MFTGAYVFLLSTTAHLQLKGIQPSDVKIVIKSEKPAGCLTVRPLRLLRLSAIPVAIGGAAQTAFAADRN